MATPDRPSRLLDLLQLAAAYLVMREQKPGSPPLRLAVTWHLWRYARQLSKRLEASYWRQVGQW